MMRDHWDFEVSTRKVLWQSKKLLHLTVNPVVAAFMEDSPAKDIIGNLRTEWRPRTNFLPQLANDSLVGRESF